jgi:flavin reductase (DIM6/NTAB) family NADH-FMN oxidoreductase RutF
LTKPTVGHPGSPAALASATAESADAVELRQRFLSAMSHAACTVSVVTTDGPAGRFGLTVSAMSSVSAEGPTPTLLVCINHRSTAADALLANGVFCVNVLRDDQSHIADTFAGRTGTLVPDKFGCAQWTTHVTGAPRVVDPLVAFDCRIVRAERVGTHFVVVGAVESVFVAGAGGAPLIYANRSYGTPQRLARTPAARPGAGGTLALGCFQTFAPYILPGLIAQLTRQQPDIGITLLEGDQQYVLDSLRGGQIELALLYDFGLQADIAGEAMTDLNTYVLLPEHHRLAAAEQIALEDLAAEPLILLDVVPSREYFLSLFAGRGLEPLVGYRTVSFEMVRGLVANGLGYSLLGTKPAHDVSYDGRRLITRPLAGDTAPSRLVLAHLAGHALSPAAMAFARHCRDFFRDHRF